MVVPCGHLQIVVRNDVDFPHRCHETSTQADADSPYGRARINARIWVENGGNQKANFVRNTRVKDQETPGELIVSKYVAESITIIAGRFGHEGILPTQLPSFFFDSAYSVFLPCQ